MASGSVEIIICRYNTNGVWTCLLSKSLVQMLLESKCTLFNIFLSVNDKLSFWQLGVEIEFKMYVALQFMPFLSYHRKDTRMGYADLFKYSQ